MNSKTLLALLAPLALLSVLSASACGQAVATCASICALPDAPEAPECADTCMASQNACDTTSCSANFQAYLTCVGNEGTYTAVDGLCASVAKSANQGDGGVIDTGAPDTGDRDTGKPKPTCANATCASVCATDGPEASSCAQSCAQTEAECPGATAAYQAVLTCFCDVGGLTEDGGTALESCTGALMTLAAECPAFSMPTPVDAGTIEIDASEASDLTCTFNAGSPQGACITYLNLSPVDESMEASDCASNGGQASGTPCVDAGIIGCCSLPGSEPPAQTCYYAGSTEAESTLTGCTGGGAGGTFSATPIQF